MDEDGNLFKGVINCLWLYAIVGGALFAIYTLFQIPNDPGRFVGGLILILTGTIWLAKGFKEFNGF